MNILSLFDGMSCGQVALERAGIQVENYFASEIDKYAIKIAQKNYPNTIQLGDIRNWKSWKLPKIDLLIGGSPCQGFSNAGHGLNFDDPRSKLFFTYVDILNNLRKKNPNLIFLLENVKMKKEWRDIISKFMGVDPIEINSALVSAQNRKRLYWTNIDGVEQPDDLGIVLADVLDDRRSVSTVREAEIRNQITKLGVEEQLNVRKDKKSNCVVPSYPHKLNGIVFVRGLEKGRRLHDDKSLSRNFREGSRIYSIDGKFPTLSAQPKGGEGGQTGLVEIRRNGHGFVPTEIKHMEKSDTLREATQYNYHIRKKSKTVRVGASNSPVGSKQEWDLISNEDYRRLFVVEYERLQTLPDNYTEGVSDSQRYKMISNGWTVDVISHIFSFIPRLAS